MPKSSVPFKRTELKRALRAAAEAGMPVQRFEIARDGNMVFHTVGNSGESAADASKEAAQKPAGEIVL